MANSERLELRQITNRCPYFEDRAETLVFHEMAEPYEAERCEALLNVGFRRQSRFYYRPVCRDCYSCVATRVQVSKFEWTRRFRRTLKANEDLQVVIKPLRLDEFQFELYSRYINVRHARGSMYPPLREQFEEMHIRGNRTFLICAYRQKRLKLVAITDQLKTGLSAQYTYFDPDEPKRSLGTYSILSQIALAQERHLPFLYLGFWIKDHPKMDYKASFKPQQRFIEGSWQSY